MKRLILSAILLFPVLVLAFWVYRGVTMKPPAVPSNTTNAPAQTKPDKAATDHPDGAPAK